MNYSKVIDHLQEFAHYFKKLQLLCYKCSCFAIFSGDKFLNQFLFKFYNFSPIDLDKRNTPTLFAKIPKKINFLLCQYKHAG